MCGRSSSTQLALPGLPDRRACVLCAGDSDPGSPPDGYIVSSDCAELDADGPELELLRSLDFVREEAEAAAFTRGIQSRVEQNEKRAKNMEGKWMKGKREAIRVENIEVVIFLFNRRLFSAESALKRVYKRYRR